MGQNEIYPSLEPNHGTQNLQFDVLSRYPLHHECVGNMRKTLVGYVAYVLNLVWTWNYCCKLEIVWADGSTFVVTMP